MRSRHKLLALALSLALLLSLAVPVCAAETTTSTTKDLTGHIVILHTNDVHGGIAGYAKLAAVKESYTASGAYALLVDAGDYIQGDPTVSASQGKTAIELMNSTGYDAATVEQELQNSLERETSTEKIGELVMEHLRDVDEVSYVRFASVYRQFKDIDTFMAELNKLLAER